MTQGNAIYAQSGGVTSVINATASAVIATSRKNPDAIQTVYGAKNGILGILREELFDTSEESDDAIARLSTLPGGVFGSCRYKLKSSDPHLAENKRLIDVFKAHNIRFLFYNGGGDSQDTINKISQLAAAADLELQCLGIPKTVDNDLIGTDCCPGFGSVAKYIATSTLEASLDVASMAESSTKVFILEVMGRHAGWIAASAGLAADVDTDPPHIILFPERVFDADEFIEKVKSTVQTVGYCVVVASEGIKDATGKYLSESGTTDAFGHKQLGGVANVLAQLVNHRLGLKFHYAVADYLQRSARHIASKVDVEQAMAVGKEAVETAIKGDHAVMMGIERLSDSPYRWQVIKLPLDSVANIERRVPDKYIRGDGYGISTACRAYLSPLIQGEAFPPFRNGKPDYPHLQLKMVDKKLPNYADTSV